jgi:putative FmdB family regulatory protein
MDNYERACQLINEYEYQCRNCQNVFRASMFGSPSSEKEVKCPVCGSIDTGRLPSWAPLGFDSARVPTEWEYECQQCHNTFKLPPPSGPSQEKEIKCPACGGEQIHRLTIISGEPLYCG